MSEWIDITTFSRDDKERVPTSFSMKLGPERIVVTRLHGHDGWWVLGLFFPNHHPLRSQELDAAKEEALNKLRAKLAEVVDSIPPENGDQR